MIDKYIFQVSQKESSSLKKVKEDNVKLASNFFNVNPPEDSKVWSNPDKSLEHPSASEIRNYNPYVRNPIYSGAHNCLCYELFNLAQHFHPTISLFAQKIMKGIAIYHFPIF